MKADDDGSMCERDTHVFTQLCHAAHFPPASSTHQQNSSVFTFRQRSSVTACGVYVDNTSDYFASGATATLLSRETSPVRLFQCVGSCGDARVKHGGAVEWHDTMRSAAASTADTWRDRCRINERQREALSRTISFDALALAPPLPLPLTATRLPPRSAPMPSTRRTKKLSAWRRMVRFASPMRAACRDAKGRTGVFLPTSKTDSDTHTKAVPSKCVCIGPTDMGNAVAARGILYARAVKFVCDDLGAVELFRCDPLSLTFDVLEGNARRAWSTAIADCGRPCTEHAVVVSLFWTRGNDIHELKGQSDFAAAQAMWARDVLSAPQDQRRCMRIVVRAVCF